MSAPFANARCRLTGTTAATPAAAAPAAAPVTSLRKPPQKAPAGAQPMDKERKRKERLGEIKIELHRALLDNLNLAALDQATEPWGIRALRYE